jgi:hypothetical protein
VFRKPEFQGPKAGMSSIAVFSGNGTSNKKRLYVRDTGAIIHEFAEGKLVGLAQIEYGK